MVYNTYVTAVNDIGETTGYATPAVYKLDKATDIVLPVDYEAVSTKYNLITLSYNIGINEYYGYWYNEDDNEDDGCWSIESEYSDYISLDFRTLKIAPGLPAGTYPATITWTYVDTFNNNNVSKTSFNINIIVGGDQEFSIADNKLPTGYINDYYRANKLSTNFGDATYTIIAGSLPEGLILSEDGYISTEFDKSITAKAGTYNFTIQATNGAATATKDFTINVYLRGDLDGDGAVTKADAAALLKHITGIKTIDGSIVDAAGDYYEEGIIDILDVIAILNATSNQQDSLAQ